jgi:hypothetical protein
MINTRLHFAVWLPLIIPTHLRWFNTTLFGIFRHSIRYREMYKLASYRVNSPEFSRPFRRLTGIRPASNTSSDATSMCRGTNLGFVDKELVLEGESRPLNTIANSFSSSCSLELKIWIYLVEFRLFSSKTPFYGGKRKICWPGSHCSLCLTVWRQNIRVWWRGQMKRVSIGW